MTPPKVLRVDETKEQRAARLRSEMHAVGTPPADAPPPTEQRLSDAALARDRHDYETMNLDEVLDREIRVALALPYDKLYANARHYLIKAGVGLMMARAKIGPVWGSAHDTQEDEETEE